MLRQDPVLPLEDTFMSLLVPRSRHDSIPWDVIVSSAPEFISFLHEC